MRPQASDEGLLQRARLSRGHSVANSSKLLPNHGSMSTKPSMISSGKFGDSTARCRDIRLAAGTRTASTRLTRWRLATTRQVPAAAPSASSCKARLDRFGCCEGNLEEFVRLARTESAGLVTMPRTTMLDSEQEEAGISARKIALVRMSGGVEE